MNQQRPDFSQKWIFVWAWLVWIVSALQVPYQFLLQSSTSVMIPMMMRSFSVGSAGVGFLSSSFFYTYLLLQIPAGILIDRFGARKLLSAGTFICAIACWLFAHAHSLAAAEFSRMLMGFATAPAVAGAMYVGSQWFSAKRFALIAGLTEMLGLLGGAFGESGLVNWVNKFGWRETLYGCAIFGLFLSILMWLVIRDRPKPHVRLRLRLTEVVGLKTEEKSSSWAGLVSVMRLPQAWINGMFCSLTFACLPAFAGLWAVPYLQSAYGLSIGWAAGGGSLVFVGAACGGPFWGWFSDHRARRRSPMIYASLIGLIVSLYCLYVPHAFLAEILVSLFLLGFFASIYVIPFAILSEITGAAVRGTALGFTNMMCILVGAPILQPLIGFLLKSKGHPIVHSGVETFAAVNYRFALFVLPLCFVLAFALSFFVSETFCQQQA